MGEGGLEDEDVTIFKKTYEKSKQVGFFSNFCGLLLRSELYVEWKILNNFNGLPSFLPHS